MNEHRFQQIINGPDIWAVCGIAIGIIVIQSCIFLKNALQESARLQISPARRHSAVRAACITAVGPSLSPVIIAMSMISIVGAPNAWLNLNNIGAARTELATIAIGASFAGVETLGSNIGLPAWSCALWACALNGAGWMLVVFFLNHRMERISSTLYQRYDPKWIKVLMSTAVTSLFCYLLGNQLIGQDYLFYIAAAVSGCCMLLLTQLCKKSQILQEISLGVSMLAGMFTAQMLA